MTQKKIAVTNTIQDDMDQTPPGEDEEEDIRNGEDLEAVKP